MPHTEYRDLSELSGDDEVVKDKYADIISGNDTLAAAMAEFTEPEWDGVTRAQAKMLREWEAPGGSALDKAIRMTAAAEVFCETLKRPLEKLAIQRAKKDIKGMREDFEYASHL